MEENERKQLKYCDIIIWISFGMVLFVKFATIFLFMQINEITAETGTTIQQVAQNYEANIFFKIAIELGKAGYMISVIILPAMAMAVYYYARRKVLKGKLNVDLLQFIVQFVFFTMCLNVVNDGASLASILANIY